MSSKSPLHGIDRHAIWGQPIDRSDWSAWLSTQTEAQLLALFADPTATTQRERTILVQLLVDSTSLTPALIDAARRDVDIEALLSLARQVATWPEANRPALARLLWHYTTVAPAAPALISTWTLGGAWRYPDINPDLSTLDLANAQDAEKLLQLSAATHWPLSALTLLRARLDAHSTRSGVHASIEGFYQIHTRSDASPEGLLSLLQASSHEETVAQAFCLILDSPHWDTAPTRLSVLRAFLDQIQPRRRALLINRWLSTGPMPSRSQALVALMDPTLVPADQVRAYLAAHPSVERTREVQKAIMMHPDRDVRLLAAPRSASRLV